MKKFLFLFKNIKFNVYLFACISFASILGTVIPQIKENPDKVAQLKINHPEISEIMNYLGLFDIYYSWYYIFLLSLLAFNVVVCKIILKKIPKLHSLSYSDYNVNAIPNKVNFEKFEVKKNQKIFDFIFSYLTTKRYKLQAIPMRYPHLGYFIIAYKNSIHRFASWISHIAIVVILFSNLLGYVYGFKEMLFISANSSVKMENKNWFISCDKFNIEWYDDQVSPKLFESDIRLFDQTQLIAETKLLVNHPLEYKKVRFYQSSYGKSLDTVNVGFFQRKEPENSPVVTLKLGQKVSVPQTPYQLMLIEYNGDFHIDEKQKVTSLSKKNNNPAVQISIFKNNSFEKNVWILKNFPIVQIPPLQSDDDFILIFAGYIEKFFTGIQVSYDPGASLFWFACCLLVVGLFLTFYIQFKKIYIYTINGDDKSMHMEFGRSVSNEKHFDTEYKNLIAEVKRYG